MNNSSKLIIRKANIDDIDILINLRKILLSTGVGHYVSKSDEEEVAWQTSYRKWLLENLHENERILVAVGNCDDDLEIVTCIIAIIDERAPMRGCLNGRVGWLQTLVVNPNFRGRGFAESMMNYTFEWFKVNDVRKVAIQTTPMAKKLHTKLGFIDSGEEFLLKEI